MTFIERLNAKADSVNLQDNLLRSDDINNTDSLSLIFESLPLNNDKELSREEKKEIGLRPKDSIVLTETFTDISIIDIGFNTRDLLDKACITKITVTDDNTYEIICKSATFSDLGSIKFRFKSFRWKIVEIANSRVIAKKTYSVL